MSDRIQSGFVLAHEGVDQLRKAAASSEVALGVADHALTVSDSFLEEADRGIDVAERGVDVGIKVGKVLIGVTTIAVIAVGVVIILRKRRSGSADPQTEPVVNEADETPTATGV